MNYKIIRITSKTDFNTFREYCDKHKFSFVSTHYEIYPYVIHLKDDAPYGSYYCNRECQNGEYCCGECKHFNVIDINILITREKKLKRILR